MQECAHGVLKRNIETGKYVCGSCGEEHSQPESFPGFDNVTWIIDRSNGEGNGNKGLATKPPLHEFQIQRGLGGGRLGPCIHCGQYVENPDGPNSRCDPDKVPFLNRDL